MRTHIPQASNTLTCICPRLLNQKQLSKADPKRVYYLSLEFLLGRSMDNALLNLGLKGTYGSKCCQ